MIEAPLETTKCARDRAYQKVYRASPENKAYQKAYRSTPEYKAYQKAYRSRTDYKTYQKKYHASPEVKAKLKASHKVYLATPEGRANREAYIARRWKTDVNYRISKTLRARLYSAIKSNVKCGSAVRDLGCSIEDFKIYIESKFQPGMTWENHSMAGWHLDHIRPLASFDLQNPNDFRCAFHFSNYQPLWATDNLLKGAKWDNTITTS
jgi:hypothetical protein